MRLDAATGGLGSAVRIALGPTDDPMGDLAGFGRRLRAEVSGGSFRRKLRAEASSRSYRAGAQYSSWSKTAASGMSASLSLGCSLELGQRPHHGLELLAASHDGLHGALEHDLEGRRASGRCSPRPRDGCAGCRPPPVRRPVVRRGALRGRPRCARPCAPRCTRASSTMSSASRRACARYSSRSLSSHRACRSSSGIDWSASSRTSRASSRLTSTDADIGIVRAVSIISRSCMSRVSRSYAC